MTLKSIESEIIKIRKSCKHWAGKRTGPPAMTQNEIIDFIFNKIGNPYKMSPILLQHEKIYNHAIIRAGKQIN